MIDVTKPRVAFVTSHPIQYQVPVFRCLAARSDLDFVVLFAMLPDAAAQGAGFGVAFEWDIPLLEGYNYRVLNNVSVSPGVTHFRGCDTPEIKSVLQELKIDVVIVNGWVVKTCLQTLWACKRSGIPCIVRGEANNLRQRPWWKRLLQRLLVRRYDAVLPSGNANRDFYRSHGVPESRMFAAPYCIENERFARAASEAEPRRAELRAQWNIPKDAVCYLYCGKFETKKHPVELVEAFLKALTTIDHQHPIHLMMVGDGDLRVKCESLISSQTADCPSYRVPITFTGFLNQSQIVDAYVAADILMLPSDAGETWGLVVNESMACGRPAIVSSDVGCASDLIEHNQTGWIFPSGDWGSLSKLITQIRAQVLTQQIADSCKNRVSTYSPETAANGIAEGVFTIARTRSNSVNSSQEPSEQSKNGHL